MEQDDICKEAQAWVEKANEADAERMRQESATTTAQMERTTLTPDLIWQALADYEITLTMDKLLRLVLRFRKTVENRIRGIAGLEISVNYTESSSSPVVVDHHNPTIKVVLQD